MTTRDTTFDARAFDIVQLKEEMAIQERRKRGAIGALLGCLLIATAGYFGGSMVIDQYDAWRLAQGRAALQEMLASAPRDTIAMDAKQLRYKVAALVDENSRLKDRLAEIYVAASEVQ